jgi:UDP-3-O-[3-hydroxymyristoyl] N-acetylglucosamine deacetylase
MAAHVCQTAQLQQTIAAPVTRVGVGLHSGERATVKLLPAGAGEGRYFVKGATALPAFVTNVADTRLSTCLGRGGCAVHTVEHLMSALEGLGVDNCRIEIEGGDEVPLLDGSAREWVEAIEESGLSIATDSSTGMQSARNAFVVDAPFSVTHGDSFVAAFPSPFTRLTYGIDFPQVPAIGSRWFSWTPTGARSYKDEVAPARTFGIAEQVEELRAAGLIKGGSLENALVCSMEQGWLNPPLRFEDEPCRHKLLDLIGDLALCATPGHAGLPVAHVVAFKASHALHVKFGAALLRHRMKCDDSQV